MATEIQKQVEAFLLEVQKPARYVGGELNQIVKDAATVDVRFAFCFPDTYEVGMSHLGMKILYSTLNAREDTWCERVFAPWPDMEEKLQEHQIPLYTLESFTPLSAFDIIGFTLQYELSYTNVLQMLSLGNVPLLAEERKGLENLVICGGPCVCNPEPLADFVDLFCLGEGEYQLDALVELYKEAKLGGWSKAEFLQKACHLEGIYVPSLYAVTYYEDGTIEAITATGGAPQRVKKAIVRDMDKVPFPEDFVVPYMGVVHDRSIVELMRGCVRGCRFCQAGFLYRPLREKSAKVVCKQAKSLCESTGYEEISLSSLSTSDYSEIGELLDELLSFTEKERINLSLPSLRIDNFSDELLEKIKRVRKSGLTFAPEAGTQRLRDVINKNITEEDVMTTCRTAFAGGYPNVKLYFMMGLPTETLDDIAGIAELAQRVIDLYFEMPDKPKGGKGGVSISISVATFVPKPFTPFQWEPQITAEEIRQRQQHLLHSVRSRKIKVSYHQKETSVLEGVLARGDRRLGKVLLAAWKKGCHLDSWEEFFHFDRWQAAFEECGLTMEFYANRRRPLDEVLPWSHLDYGISDTFLKREHAKAMAAEATPQCRLECASCGANQLIGGACFG